jgi:hypothetical protein
MVDMEESLEYSRIRRTILIMYIPINVASYTSQMTLLRSPFMLLKQTALKYTRTRVLQIPQGQSRRYLASES